MNEKLVTQLCRDCLGQEPESVKRLLNMECDTDCVDFMGERGMQFMDKKVAVNDEIIYRLNGIFERLWKEFIKNANCL